MGKTNFEKYLNPQVDSDVSSICIKSIPAKIDIREKNYRWYFDHMTQKINEECYSR